MDYNFIILNCNYMNHASVFILLLFGSACVWYNYRKLSKSHALKANNPLSPLHGWHLNELDKTNLLAPWNEVLKSPLVDSSVINLPLDADNHYLVSNYDYESESIPQVKRYNLDDLVFVNWRSPAESWKHLAGRKGFVVVSISEKKQIDFITTAMS